MKAFPSGSVRCVELATQLPQRLHFSSLKKIKEMIKVRTNRNRGEMSMSLV